MTGLIIAIPSKGRLQDNTHAFFARAGLSVRQPGGARNYRGRLAGFDGVEIAFLSASEIARELAAGTAHLGVTGLDLVHETIAKPETAVHIVTPLGFGHANVVVAAPASWIDVNTMADLADVASAFRARHGRRMRVATKYVALTRDFFAAHGIADYRIVESAGATEGAPAAGTAELIVDITSTGSTLTANDLKVLDDGVILKSEAHLVASLAATWSPEALASARAILDRIAAEERARGVREIRALVAAPEFTARSAAEQYGCVAPFGTQVGQPLLLHCPAQHAADCASLLREHGAPHVSVTTLDYVFGTANPLYDPLSAKVGG
ncbi:ATP phosphoribosyltransferase [Stappia indica]|uniref:ATP phosphoribosyltransferase n=1 Tax=Stappia indica TaxID=538381 RepID=UPI001CD2807B|nr:ATP phosphoribosyltransferase [Stappia indica]MCA1297709.1 ATP phosphoribosyltransferase [Stappia indica]